MRRYLIANHGSKAILQNNIPREVNKYRFISYVAAFENKQIKNYNLPFKPTEITQFDSITKSPSKCCPICMSLGFHSEIFNLDWLTFCPLHKVKLSAQCPKCSREWKSFIGLLRNNKCSCCGVITRFDELFSATIDTSIFEFLISLYDSVSSSSVGIQLDSQYFLYYQKHLTVIEKIKHFSASNRSVIHFSILNSENRLSKAEKLQLLKYQIPIVKISKFKFDLAKYQNKPYRKFDSSLLDKLVDHFLGLIHQTESKEQNSKISFRGFAHIPSKIHIFSSK